jgi:hypothetical protein
MGFSFLGLYVFPSVLSSFKELARRIKQSNEQFGFGLQDAWHFTPTASCRAAESQKESAGVNVSKNFARIDPLLGPDFSQQS